MVTKSSYLDLRVFKDIAQVLGDPVVRPQVLLREVDCLLVRQNRCGIRLQELLFDPHIMVRNGQHRSPVFICLRLLALLGCLLLVIQAVRVRIQALREHHFLEQDDRRHRVVKGQLVLIQLGQHSADVQVRVRLYLGPLKLRLDGQRLLKEVQRRPHFADPTVVASHIVEGHRLAKLIILAKFLRLLE